MAISKPFTFVAGTKARASEVNQNFDTLYAEANRLGAELLNVDTNIQRIDDEKADINGNSEQRFQVANGVNGFDAVNMNQLRNTTPVGSVIMLLHNNIPDGFLACDGSAVSRTTYSDLFNIIGTTYGTGQGNITFNLPDFRNRVAWGVDVSTSMGYYAAGLPNITGSNTIWLGTYTSATGCMSRYGGGTAVGGNTYGANNSTLSIDASRSSSIYGKSTTVQPPSVKVVFAIKY